ncbi:GTPase HflX [Treponema brennaborense]|uniref:GTPase HflX n=1 Tax=Treponema brennaborense (strain DSM 12168 / CIP 105900 / DD5/3) TaxID=906968 RepID=F4LPF2_TREBD|nr:GTPase HflX [Treponema brennaborense]AEE15963.1 GTP-binding proten HflX [Treponema brennaborense DSM 12168]
MIDIHAEQTAKIKAYLVAAAGTSPAELKGLVSTLDMETVGVLVLSRAEPDGSVARFGIGSGKAQEIADLASELEADCIIFDFEISPTRQRNWEKLAGVPVFDRHEVILRIFAARARTKEAVLQVELARLTYSLPRLAHSYGDMARQRGGSYGSKGAGETKLELDRRTVQDRIAQVRRELTKVVRERETQRRRRDRVPLPSCALVGYTNAGKSSLLNALTGASVLAEDKLFATLDPTTRRLSIAGGTSLLLTDTVGFISNLPHNLVDAFKSTLEEAVRADLLVVVIDAADPAAAEQYATVCRVLEEIGADSKPRIAVLNKTDKLAEFDVRRPALRAQFSDAVEVSAHTKAGFDVLIPRICNALAGVERRYRIPLDQHALLTQVRKGGTIADEQWLDGFIEFAARIGGSASGKLLSLLAPYEVE